MLDSCWSRVEVFYKLLPKQKNAVAFYWKKSECQKRSGIQLRIIFDSSSPVCPGQGSPFPSLLSAPDISFSPSRSGEPFVPNHSPPTATAASFPLSSLGTFPPPPRPSELMYGASLQDCSLWHWAWGWAIKRGIIRHLHSEVNDEECEPSEHLFLLFSRGPSIYSWFSSTRLLTLNHQPALPWVWGTEPGLWNKNPLNHGTSQLWGYLCNSRGVRKQLETFFAGDERNTGKAGLSSGLELDSGLYKWGNYSASGCDLSPSWSVSSASLSPRERTKPWP